MNPAEHEARADAERHGTVVGGDVDRIEHLILDDLADEECGAWPAGEAPSVLWGTEAGGV